LRTHLRLILTFLYTKYIGRFNTAGGERALTSCAAVREAAMEYAACNVVYVDRAAKEDKLVKRDDVALPASTGSLQNHVEGGLPVQLPSAVDRNLQTLLKTFSEGQYHSSPIRYFH
jgi:hypothetical protein